MDAMTQHRSFVLGHVRDGRISVDEAAAILRISERQVQRLLAALRAEGVAGLVHGNRGRAPGHRTPELLRARLVELATTTYAGLDRAHLADLLAEREGLVVPVRTLRRVLAEAGLTAARKRRPAPAPGAPRTGRAGRPAAAARWQPPPMAGARRAVPDAGRGHRRRDGVVTAGTFRAQEDAAGYFAVLSHTVWGFGLPAAVYSDRHTIFVSEGGRMPSLAEQLAGREPTTQVGRALAAAGIGWIGARSPQAKGRIERLWGTLQDRLVAELRLAGASSLGGGQRRPGGLPAAPQRALRGARRRCRRCLAAVVVGGPGGGRVLLPLSAARGQRCHGQLDGTTAGGATPLGRWQLGGPRRDRRGTARRQPLAGPP